MINDGAQVINSGDDILKEYSLRPMSRSVSALNPHAFAKKLKFNDADNPDKLKAPCAEKDKIAKNNPMIENLNEDERKIYKAIADGSTQINDMVERVEMPSHKVLGALTTLELLGLIKPLPGKHYEII